MTSLNSNSVRIAASARALFYEFFKALIENDVLLGPANRNTLKSLVTLSWILSDNWINYTAVDSRDIYPDMVREGYVLVIDLFRPYLSPATLIALQHERA